MLIRAAQLLSALSRSRWRFAPAVVLLVIAATISEPPRVLHLAVSPMMVTSGFATGLANRFSSDTGIPVVLVQVRGEGLARRAEDGEIDVGFTRDNRFASRLEPLILNSKRGLSKDFVLIGPRDDPADIWDATSAVNAFWRIEAASAPFQPAPRSTAEYAVETRLWRKAGMSLPPPPSLQSMAQAVNTANARRAYMLIGRPTFELLGTHPNLMLLFQGDPALVECYRVAEFSRAPNPRPSATSFWKWFQSPRGRDEVRMVSLAAGYSPLM